MMFNAVVMYVFQSTFQTDKVHADIMMVHFSVIILFIAVLYDLKINM